VEEAWRIVDPVLKAGTPIAEYEKRDVETAHVDDHVSPAGRWQNPAVPEHEDLHVTA
jgi:glucose-6-phosphate 1-dehydrogenase